MNVASITEFRNPSMSKLHKPSQPRRYTDPAEAARHAKGGTPPDSWGRNDAALDLPANEAVEHHFERGMETPRRVRYDVFALLFHTLKSRMAPTTYDAVRRFQSDLAVLHRTQGTSDAIRATGVGAQGAYSLVTADFSISRVMAAKRIERAHGMMKPHNVALLDALCEPEVIRGEIPNWHAVVQRLRGERDRRKRGTHVIDAADDLAAAYRLIDNEPKEAAA